jgi:cytochrome P450
MAAKFDMGAVLWDPEYRRDPHPWLKRLREEAPVHRSDASDMWFVAKHADAVRLARSPLLGRDLRYWRSKRNPYRADNDRIDKLVREVFTALQPQMFHSNAPDHTRMRRVFQHAFTPRAVAKMEQVVRDVTKRLIAALPSQGTIELMSVLAKPLPVEVICGLFEVPLDDAGRLSAWSEAVSETVEPTIQRAQIVTAKEACDAFSVYLTELVAMRRRQPGDGLIDNVIAAETQEGGLNEAELLMNLMSMLVAGHETTTNLIGNGMWSLLSHPAQLARLRADPDLLKSCIEECLRFEPAGNTNARVTLEDLEVGGQTIVKGELIMIMIAAANRDPDVFQAPDAFDAGRSPNPHQTFGGGIHHCIGAPLARLEASVAFELLLQRYGTLELLDPEPHWRNRINLRGLSELRLRVHGG